MHLRSANTRLEYLYSFLRISIEYTDLCLTTLWPSFVEPKHFSRRSRTATIGCEIVAQKLFWRNSALIWLFTSRLQFWPRREEDEQHHLSFQNGEGGETERKKKIPGAEGEEEKRIHWLPDVSALSQQVVLSEVCMSKRRVGLDRIWHTWMFQRGR